MTTLFSAATTLILVMDPLGNIPVFLTILNTVEPKKRSKIILREIAFAFLILSLFFFAGKQILNALSISEPALGIAGGIILFLIAIKMIFPPEENEQRDRQIGEPFIVPLAIPLIAGPSALTAVTLLASEHHRQLWTCYLALIVATLLFTIILLFAGQIRKILGPKGLTAFERLMGMILTTVAVQMFLNGIQSYFHIGA